MGTKHGFTTGDVIAGKYRVEKKLGKGGFGAVYLVTDKHLEGVRYAMKVPHPHLLDEDLLKRFRSEAVRLDRLTHPNIVGFRGFHEVPEEDLVFYLLEYVDGAPLHDLLYPQGLSSDAESPTRGADLGVGRTLRLVRHVLLALEHAHGYVDPARGPTPVVHRDIKPENVIVAAPGSPHEMAKVLDFGIAVAVGSTRHTKTGAGFMGTGVYAPPEQAKGKKATLDARTDIFAAGTLLYEMCMGRLPFDSESPVGAIFQREEYAREHGGRPAPPFAEKAPDRSFPPGVEAIAMRAMEFEPGRRFQSAGEMIEAIEGLGILEVGRGARRGSGGAGAGEGARAGEEGGRGRESLGSRPTGGGGGAGARDSVGLGETRPEAAAHPSAAAPASVRPERAEPPGRGESKGSRAPLLLAALAIAALGVAWATGVIPLGRSGAGGEAAGAGASASTAASTAPSTAPAVAGAPAPPTPAHPERSAAEGRAESKDPGASAASAPAAPPSFLELSPPAGALQVLPSASIHVRGRLSDPALSPVRIGEPGKPAIEKAVGPDGRFEARPALDPDATALEVSAGSGAREVHATIPVAIDLEPPKVTLEAPAEWGGGPLAVAAVVEDAHPRSVSFTLLIDGKPAGAPLERPVTRNGERVAATLSVPAGATTLAVEAVAEDGADRRGSARRPVAIDRTGPPVTITSPRVGLATNAEALEVVAKVDPKDVVGGAEVALRAPDAAEVVHEVAVGAGGTVRMARLDLPRADGPCTLEVRVRDRVGNVGRGKAGIIVDRTAPRVTATGPGAPLAHDAASASVTFRSDEPLASLVVDGQERVSGTGAQAGPWRVDVPLAQGQTREVTALGRDAAGNVSEVARASVSRAAKPLERTDVGWLDEKLPKGMKRGPAKPVLFWKNPGDASSIEIEMVYVPPGDFWMGADDSGQTDEQPRHKHPMPGGYWIGRTETTWAHYKAFCRATGRAEPAAPAWGAKDDHPVVNVDWSDASAFCTWAGLALPSEAQWEKAARGTEGKKYPWGEQEPTAELCVWAGHPTYGNKSTAPVGSCPRGASPCGALDMAGNVWEWCADWYDGGSYARYARGDASPPNSGPLRVVRGGSWYDGAGDARAAYRGGVDPSYRLVGIGFRPARVTTE